MEDFEKYKNPFYVLSLSFGKDSMALLCEIIKNKYPLDSVVFCDIKFNENISGEHPLMAKWIKEYAENKVNAMLMENGYNFKVTHLTSKKNFIEQFYTIKQKGNHVGDNYGFPYVIGAWCNSRLKLVPVHNYINTYIKSGKTVIEYIGIAKDEPKRLERYADLTSNNHRFITLADFNIDENTALEICKQNNLLSPKYEKSFRGGCWFCPKQCQWDLYCLWHDYPDYYNMLQNIEKDSHNTFKPDITLLELRKKFESGYIPKRRK